MATKRKHDEVDGAKPALQRLYETGEWSDLTIQAGGKSFKVHKAILCPASRYFHSACSRGFRESLTSTISLPESEKIVDALLRHFYETPAAWTQIPKPPPRVKSRPIQRPPSRASGFSRAVVTPAKPITDPMRKIRALDLIELRVVADKYGITSIVPGIEATFADLVDDIEDNPLLIDIGLCIFQNDGNFLEDMRSVVVQATALVIQEISAEDVTFAKFHKDKEYLRRTIMTLDL